MLYDNFILYFNLIYDKYYFLDMNKLIEVMLFFLIEKNSENFYYIIVIFDRKFYIVLVINKIVFVVFGIL